MPRTTDPLTMRRFADDVESVWGEFADEDVIELANEAKAALVRLAERIERGEPAPETTRMVYRTYTNGVLRYSGPDLEAAIRMWDAMAVPGVPGGVAVATYEVNSKYPSGLLQVRDGWILHCHDDQSVYLNPSLQEK